MKNTQLLVVSVLSVLTLSSCGCSGPRDSGKCPTVDQIYEELNKLTNFTVSQKETFDIVGKGAADEAGTRKFTVTAKDESQTSIKLANENEYALEITSGGLWSINLSEYLDAYETTEAVLESQKDSIESSTHREFALDHDGNKFTLTKESNPMFIGIGYDKTAKQGYTVTSKYNKPGEYMGTYLKDSDYSKNSFRPDTDDLGDFEAFIEHGTFDAKTRTLSLTAEEYPEAFEGSEYASASIKFKGNLPIEMKYTLNEECVKKEIPVIEYTGTAESVIKIENIGKTSYKLPEVQLGCKNNNHKAFQYDATEDGHRKYCTSCGKYVAEKEAHHHDAHNYCSVCRGLYDVEDHEVEDFVSTSGDSFVIFKKAKNGDELFANGVNWHVPGITSTYQSGTSWYIFPNDGAVMKTSSGAAEYFIDNNCSTIYTDTYTLYKGLTIVKGEDNKYTFDGHEEIADAIASKTPIEVTATNFSFSHDSTEKHETAIDDCHTREYYICDRCGETTSDKIIAHHTSEKFEVVAEEDLPFTPTYEKDIYIKSECEHCHEVNYYGVSSSNVYSHATSNLYAMHYDPETGDYIDYGTPIQVPHIFDEEGVCEICGAEKHEVGTLIFLVEYDYADRKCIRTPIIKATGQEVPYTNYSSEGHKVEELGVYVQTYIYYDKNTSDSEKVELARKVVYFDDEYGVGNVTRVELISGSTTVTITGDINPWGQ